MMLKDSRGVPLSTTSQASLACLEQATELLNGYFNDPLAVIDAALAEDPAFVMGHCFRAMLHALFNEMAMVPEMRRSLDAAKALMGNANERERRHVAAAGAWADGDLTRAAQLYGEISIEYPRDLLALQFGHQADFFTGQSSMLRDRVARVLPDWAADTPGFGYVLGMHAFGLEEMGDYARAEERGRAALATNRRDPWAVHAVAHVMEMQGRLDDGIDWLNTRVLDWAHDNGFAFHNWWHLALYHLDLGQPARALDLYDAAIRPKPSDMALEMVDAAALLWRLHLRGVDVGGRWRDLAETWQAKSGDGWYAFNDAHAMMAFVGGGRMNEADALLEAVLRSATQGGTNAMMARDVGVPVCQALYAFGRGDYGRTVDLLLPVRAFAHRFGGSHAQRDVLSLTLIEAALRAKQGRLARALLAERAELKPASLFAWGMTARALDLIGDVEQAADARRAAAALGHKAPEPRGKLPVAT